MTEPADNASNPVIEHGPYRRLLSGDVLRYQPGRVVVLTGPGGYRVVSADEPISRLQRWLKAYTHYAIVDTTAKQTVRTYRHTHSSDPRYSFDIQVTMSAKVDDPVAFLQDFGRDASVFDAFYNELIEDVANTLSDCPIDDLVDTQQRLSAYAREIKKDQPFYKGVKIHQFNVVVKYGPELLRKLEEYDLRAMYHRDGEEGLVLPGAMDPATRARNRQLLDDLRSIQEYHHKKNFEHAKAAIKLAREFAEAAGIDFIKVARQSGLDQRLRTALAPPPPRKEARVLLFSEQFRSRAAKDRDRSARFIGAPGQAI